MRDVTRAVGDRVEERAATTGPLGVAGPAEDAPGLLVLSEVYYPAWKAYVDDLPVPLLAANHALRAVPVPADRSRKRCAISLPRFASARAASSSPTAARGS